VISADVRMHDFRSPSFATLCALLVARNTAPTHEVHLLHDAGRVIAVVDTVEGPLPGPFADVVDPVASARTLREARGAARSIVAEAGALRAALAAVERGVTASWTQPSLLVALQQAFRDCAGVVADPPLPSLAGWRLLQERLAGAGDGAVVLAARDGDAWSIAIAGRLVGGVIVEATDLAPDAIASLPELDALAVALGERVAAALVTSVEDLRRIFSSPDVATEIAAALTGPVELR
jgi:hypothetical protein